MFLIAILLISTVSHSIANPIPQYNHELLSGSGSSSDYDSGSGSGSSLKHNDQNTNNDNNNHHSCKTACKVFTYTFIIIIGCCLLGLCCLLTTMVYECCIKDICIDCSHLIQGCCLYIKNHYFICAFFKTRQTTQTQTTAHFQYIENESFTEKQPVSYYNKFNTMYNKLYKNQKPINTECPICLDPINKNIYTLHCKHAYHKKCMKHYINSSNYNNECALCRNTIVVD